VIRKLLPLIFLIPAAGARAADYAIENVNLWTGDAERILEDATVLVADGRIERLGSGLEAPAGYEVIDGEGHYVLPGLFDVHTHLGDLASARRALESGVTTVRSASTDAYQDVGFRELVDAGHVAGPDMLAAGVYVTPDLGDTILADPRLAALGQATPLRCSCHEYRLLAQGAAEFVLSDRLNPWDHAAGVLICQRAGGVARMLDGRAYDTSITDGVLLCAGSEAAWTILRDHFAELA